jgi:DNA-binding transcriptional LysR family regulator
MFDWNDLKPFLAVARGGSTLAAAKALGVNQTTVARRIEALEAALSLKLFERGQSGSRLTEAGRELMAEAEKVEQAAKALQTRAETHGRGLSGTLRVTSIELLANTALTTGIAEFRQLHPEVQVDVLISDERLDIEAGEADIAIRFSEDMPSSNLVARRIADYPSALFCSRDYAARRGAPATLAELCGHDLIGGDGVLAGLPTLVWMFDQAGGKAPSLRSNSLSHMVYAVKAGLGIAPLPCAVADGDPNLVRCSDLIDTARAPAWLVTRRELKDTPRVRAFIDFIVPYLRRRAALTNPPA